MTVTAHAVQELRDGAHRARAGDAPLPRLADLFDSIADLARMAVDEDEQGTIKVGVPQVIANGCRVARHVRDSPL